MSVGVMEDYKLRDLRASHTLGAAGMKHKELKAWGYWSFNCLLWIDEVRAKDKTYIWVSVWWFTDERLKTKTTEESTHLTYTELFGKLEHLKIETMLIDECWWVWWVSIVVYYESMKREAKTRPIYECRCDECRSAKVLVVFVVFKPYVYFQLH
jgi:hypothetical protein